MEELGRIQNDLQIPGGGVELGQAIRGGVEAADDGTGDQGMGRVRGKQDLARLLAKSPFARKVCQCAHRVRECSWHSRRQSKGRAQGPQPSPRSPWMTKDGTW